MITHTDIKELQEWLLLDEKTLPEHSYFVQAHKVASELVRLLAKDATRKTFDLDYEQRIINIRSDITELLLIIRTHREGK